MAFDQTGTPSRALHRLLLENSIDPSAEQRRADVIIADVREETVDRVQTIARNLRAAHPAKPLIVLVTPAQITGPTLIPVAADETVVISSRGERALIAEINRKALDRDFAAEAAVRIQAMTAVGLGHMPDSPSQMEPSALLVTPPGPMALELSSSLSAHLDLHTVMSRQQALTALELQVADRVFVLPDTSRRPMAAMVKLIRRHSELNALPVIVFERQPTDRHRDYWSRTGADMVIPVNDTQVAVAVATQRRHERNALTGTSRFLRHASFTELGEPSRLCAPRFFDAALDLRCSMDLPFSIGAMRLTPHKSGDSHHIFTEPSIYVALGVQPADLVTRAAPDLLLMSFPGTDIHHAKRAMTMLSTLVKDLKFGTTESPMTFSPQTNAIAAPAGADPRALIRDVIKGLGSPKPADALFA